MTRSLVGEVRRGLDAALRLARGDASAIAELDLSFEGFWRSFLAAVVALPPFIIMTAGQYSGGHAQTVPLLLVEESVGYALGWTVFPLAAIALTRVYLLGNRYVPLVVAANWTAVVQAYAFAAASALSGIFVGPFGAAILLGTIAALVIYEWFVVRAALATTAGVAATFVAVDLVVSLALSTASDALIRGW